MDICNGLKKNLMSKSVEQNKRLDVNIRKSKCQNSQNKTRNWMLISVTTKSLGLRFNQCALNKRKKNVFIFN